MLRREGTRHVSRQRHSPACGGPGDPGSRATRADRMKRRLIPFGRGAQASPASWSRLGELPIGREYGISTRVSGVFRSRNICILNCSSRAWALAPDCHALFDRSWGARSRPTKAGLTRIAKLTMLSPDVSNGPRKRSVAQRAAGAEGATAPEPLRQKDRGPTTLWKAVKRSSFHPPKMTRAYRRSLGGGSGT